MIREWLQQGRIGEIKQARMTVRCQGMLPVGDVQPFLLNRQPYLKDFARLLIFEVLIHNLDVMRVLLGPLEVVAAQTAKVNQELAGEDAAVVLLKGTGGVTAVLDGNISAPGYGPLPVDRLEVMGTRGTLLFDGDRLAMVGSDEPPVVFDLAKNYQACFSRAVAEFVYGLLESQPFAMDRLDNLETLKLMEQSYVAAGVKI